MDHDIFISYAQRVPEPTVALADELVRRGFRPWYDVNLLPGQFFGKVIDDAIDKAKAVVTIWSPPALSSLWVPAESARALRQNKLICVRTVDLETGKLPTPFHNMHTPVWTDFSAVVQALIAMGVRPGGLGDATVDTEKQMHAAQRDWRAMPDHDAEALEAFLEEYGEFPMYRRMAQKRLDALRTAPLSPRPVQKPEPPSVKAEDVLLRLDPEMHTAAIRRISVSADGRQMATASHDKTVKLWELPEGKALRTLRTPIGPGDEGKVYAVALDPAGRWVAAGGWDKGYISEAKGSCFVNLFDTSTGALRARLGPLPNVVLDLAVSPDGTRLAAGLFGKNGLRVWDTSRALAGEVRPVFEDREIGGSVYGLAFGPAGTATAGRLAATSDDGQVRLYAPEGQWLAKVKALGEGPSGIAFSPDGRTLAVGYADALRVDLLDAGTLRVLGSADVAGLSGGNLSSVAFLHPAQPGAAPSLVAGGKRTSQGRLFVWAEAGRGSRSVWPGPDNSVMDLAALPDGGLVFSAADPAFGLLNADGKRTLFCGPATADLRGKRREHFTVSADGRRLRFGLKEWSGASMLFDLDRRQLSEAPNPLPDLAPATTDRLPITGWENGTAPQRDGKALPLEPYETARSLAIAPDARSFVLGTEWWLRRYDAKGAPLWQQPVPGVVWGVNLACAGRLILAAYGDGTIRWHRAEDGKELLALFIHLPKGPDGPREWILFTPEGYYQASSPEAEKLIGWHLNRGPDEAADFLPVETFASTYRNPAKITAALAGF